MTDQPDSYYTVQPADTFHSLAQLCYHDRNKWMRIREVNQTLQSYGPDQPLPAGTQLTLPFIPELTTTIITEEGDTLRALAKFFYSDEDQKGNKWMRIREVNQTLQSYGPDQPLPAGLQLTLPFIPERTIILLTEEGDTLHAFAKIYYDDENQWVRIGEANTTIQAFGPDQPLPVGLCLTLPFIPKLTTAILTGEGDTLRSLAKFFYHNEDQWLRIRQVNSPLQGLGPDQLLPAGRQLTLPSFTITTVIITEKGDTFRSLAQTYYHNEAQWLRIRQVNLPLQGFGPDQPLPVGLELQLSLIVMRVTRAYTTGSNDTFTSLAQKFYHDGSKWLRIRQANPSLQRYNSDQPLPAGRSVTIP